MSITIRPYTPHDWQKVVELWNASVTRDPLTPERFWQLFLLDQNFRAEGFLVAEAEGLPIGWMQIVTKGAEGWLTAFCVHPDWRRQGVARRLWEAHEVKLVEHGVNRVTCNGYAPYYLFPGVDEEYLEAQEFLKSVGFHTHTEAVAMGMNLEGVRTPPAVCETRAKLEAEGIEVRLFRHEDTLPLLEFTDTHFPYWGDSVRDGLRQGNLEIMVALHHGEPVGLTQWENTYTDPPHGLAGRFGPFGIREDMRSKGIGAVIFFGMIERAQAKGARYLWFGWAGGRNVRFYERMGCRVTRRFVLYRRELQE